MNIVVKKHLDTLEKYRGIMNTNEEKTLRGESLYHGCADAKDG